jgi:hypothetical protein
VLAIDPGDVVPITGVKADVTTSKEGVKVKFTDSIFMSKQLMMIL